MDATPIASNVWGTLLPTGIEPVPASPAFHSLMQDSSCRSACVALVEVGVDVAFVGDGLDADPPHAARTRAALTAITTLKMYLAIEPF